MLNDSVRTTSYGPNPAVNTHVVYSRYKTKFF